MGFDSPAAPTLIYQNVLTADTATLDTGANAIPAVGNILEVYVIARTDEAATGSSVAITFNGDTGNNYDRSATTTTNASVAGSSALAATGLGVTLAAANDAANVASALRLTIPAFAGTTFYKSGMSQLGVPDTTAANTRNQVAQFSYRSTAAITQVTFAITSGAGQKFKAGSAIYVYVK